MLRWPLDQIGCRSSRIEQCGGLAKRDDGAPDNALAALKRAAMPILIHVPAPRSVDEARRVDDPLR